MSDEFVETGLAGLTVTEPVTPPPSVPALLPPMPPKPAAVIPVKFTVEDALSVARKVAMSMGPLETVLTELDITPEIYEQLSQDPFYIEALARANEEWHSIKSTHQRVILKTAAIIEDSLLVNGARLSNKLEPLEKVAQLTKVYSDIAGLGKQQQQNGPQERVTISIDFGADNRLVVEKTIEAAALQSDGEGEGHLITVQPQPEGPEQKHSLPANANTPGK